MMMKTSTVKTWRERLGFGQDFPLHAPTDVERAMEAEIAELRAAAAADAARLDALELLGNEREGILLHDGEPGRIRNNRGLGLAKLGRTLRQAVDVVLASGKIAPADPYHGYCADGDHCVCGGDLPRVRAGCGNWRKV